MSKSSLRDAPNISLEATVSRGSIGPFGMQPYEGTLWNLLRTYSDGYWNELFLEDREGGVVLVYRVTPYKDLNGKLIQKDAIDPGSTLIEKRDIRRMDVMRSDDRVANFYWVSAPSAYLQSDADMKKFSHQGVGSDYFIQTYANVDPDLYGLRMMEVQTEQGHGDATHRPGPNEKTIEEKELGLQGAWINERRADLVALNQDNVMWEEGTITMRGNEAVRVGRYLELHDGELQSSYYVSQVDHTFRPFLEFITDVHVERGTGFLVRNQAVRSPYLAERRDGVY